MSSSDLNVGAQYVRPKYLSPASLMQRAVLGLTILMVGTFGAVLLYDASIKANASVAPSTIAVSPAVQAK